MMDKHEIETLAFLVVRRETMNALPKSGCLSDFGLRIVG